MSNGYGSFLALFVAVGVCMVLLFGLPRPETIGTPYSQFREHWAQWNAHRPDSYSIHIHRGCFCFPSWSVHSVVGANGAEKIQHDGDPPSAEEDISNRYFYPRNVDDVFRTIDRLYKEKAYRIDLIFDSSTDIPVKASIDREGGAVDDEIGFTLDHFEVEHVG